LSKARFQRLDRLGEMARVDERFAQARLSAGDADAVGRFLERVPRPAGKFCRQIERSRGVGRRCGFEEELGLRPTIAGDLDRLAEECHRPLVCAEGPGASRGAAQGEARLTREVIPLRTFD
jgi:hypothetical protein